MVALPDYTNNVQGTVTQSNNPLAWRSPGRGSSRCRSRPAQVNDSRHFNPQPYYTRAGDFQLNSTGYLVNSAGEYLNGWTVDPTTGIVNQNSLAPIQMTQT